VLAHGRGGSSRSWGCVSRGEGDEQWQAAALTLVVILSGWTGVLDGSEVVAGAEHLTVRCREGCY
jgi:hypothetical protein